ncbi:hypothetical protein RIF29_39077 [Crotalaria pallida]|uniref:Uncharacterized protein n=1 Tax=Crotalaria pallida TaxID=3830 RepID=A0AAN9E0J8_CROPI
MSRISPALTCVIDYCRCSCCLNSLSLFLNFKLQLLIASFTSCSHMVPYFTLFGVWGYGIRVFFFWCHPFSLSSRVAEFLNFLSY